MQSQTSQSDCASSRPEYESEITSAKMRSGISRASLFSRLLTIRESERQRFGQELHDSAGQLLVALQLSIARLRIIEAGCGHEDLMVEIDDTIRQIDREIRSLAFMEYPAELGDRGVVEAVQSLCRDFGRRAGIRVTFDSIGDFAIIGSSIATAVLRVIQEALVNVHRHAHASVAVVTIEKSFDRLQFTIADDGVGMPKARTGEARGIGLQGMRHRVETLGGEFEVVNLARGLKISGSVPLAA